MKSNLLCIILFPSTFAQIPNGISMLLSLEWTNPSPRGVLQNVVFLCVISKYQQCSSLGPSRAVVPQEKKFSYANSSDNEVKTVLDTVKAVTLFHIISSHEFIITANHHTQSLTSPSADFDMD